MKDGIALSPTSPLVVSAFDRIPLLADLAHGLTGKRLLLTGGTGFFGRWLLALLHRLERAGAGVQLTVVSRNPAGFLALHPEYRDARWLHWACGDVRGFELPDGQRLDLVLHAAADTSAAAGAHQLELLDTIVGGARRVLDAATRAGAGRILFTGSGAQYGAIPAGHPVAEDAPFACDALRAGNAYGESKRMQEMLAAIHAERTGIEPVLTRCFAFAGPGLPLDAHFAIGNVVRDALHADAIVLHSAGDAVRSYLHGADLAAWLLFLLLHGQAGEAYNVGSDDAISIADLARRAGARIAPHKPLRILGRASGHRSYYVPDIARARSLGLDVWTPLDTSIDEMARWAGNAPDDR